MNEVRVILDKLFYKDVRTTIESFLFVDCKICDKEILEDNGLISIDDRYYCGDCIKKPYLNKCVECLKYYSLYDCSLRCFLCFSQSCKLYCENCYIKKKIHIELIEMDIPHLDLYWTTRDIDAVRDYLDNLTDIDMDITYE